MASAQVASDAARAAATAAGPPAAARAAPGEPATIYVYVGHTYWPGHSQDGVEPSDWVISVDGGPWVALKQTRFLEFDTAAGAHRITRRSKGLINGPPASIDLTLAPGEEAYVALNWYSDISPKALHNDYRLGFASGFLFGVAGVAAGVAIVAATQPTTKSPDQHKLGVWLERESAPPAESTGAATGAH